MRMKVSDVVDAIDKNDYKQVYGDYIQYNRKGDIVGACALGQAALNLNVDPYALGVRLMSIDSGMKPAPISIWYLITFRLNDQGVPPKEIAKRLRELNPDVLNTEINI